MKKNSTIEKIVKKYKETGEIELLIYMVLRILVIACMVLEILKKEWNNAVLCLLTLILFTLPTMIEDKLKIRFPTVLESFMYVFIFLAEILGEINNFYGIIPYWDTFLHTINGFLAAGVGFSLVDLLNENSKNISLSPFFVAIVSVCFSMTIGILWEFFEYGADKYLKIDMQKDKVITSIQSTLLDSNNKNKAIVINNIKSTEIITDDEVIVIEGGYLDVGLNDTMNDLLVNFIGAITFSSIGFLYINNRDKYKFAENFIPIKKE